jgi:hypothetical protein
MSKTAEELTAWENNLEVLKIKLDSRERDLTSREQGTPKPDDVAKSKDFYLKEYESLRAEILQTLADSRSLERNVVFGVGVFLAWIMTHKNAPLLAWSIPLVLVILAMSRSGALLWSFRVYSTYLRDVEKSFSNSENAPTGWETFRKKRSLGIFMTSIFFWLALLAGSIVVLIMKPTVANDSTSNPQTIIQNTGTFSR